MVKRGVVISPLVGNKKAYINYDYSFQPAYLRWLVLYWDIIDCPNGKIVEIPLKKNLDDLSILAKEGIFIRTKGFFFSKAPGSNVLLSVHHDNPVAFWSIAQQYTFFKHKLFDDQSEWTLSQPKINLYFPSKEVLNRFFFVESGDLYAQQKSNVIALQGAELFKFHYDFVKTKSIDIKLEKCLIVPNGDIPMEQVLEFKRKRLAELLRFRHAMDGIYLSILSSGDIPKATTFAIDELTKALIDINKVMKESFLSRVLSSIETMIDSNRIFDGINKGREIGNIFQLPEVGAAIGGVLSLIKINPSSFLKPRQISDNLKDYVYLYHIQEELR